MENSFLRIFHKRTIQQPWANSLSSERFIQSPSLQERLGNSSSSQNSLKILGIVIKQEEAGCLPQCFNCLSRIGEDHYGRWWHSTQTSFIRLLFDFCCLRFSNCSLFRRIALLPRSHVSVSRSPLQPNCTLRWLAYNLCFSNLSLKLGLASMWDKIVMPSVL